MSKTLTPTSIQKLVKSGILIPSNHTRERIFQEDQALKALDRKNDYLSKYNCILRHIFLLMLKSGFDINSSCVHRSFVEVTLAISRFEKSELLAVVKSRHRKKYAGILPSKIEESILDEVLLIYRQQND